MTKFSKLNRSLLLPAALLAALIVGAGIFALPFVFSEAGFLIGGAYLLFFTCVFVAIHRMYADVILGTSGEHRFVGYAEIYLGRIGFLISIFTTAVGLLLILIVYIALAEEFLGLIVPWFNNSSGAYLFWALGSLAVVLSIRRLERLEVAVTAAIGAIVLLLFAIGAVRGGGDMLPLFNASSSFLPYGVILFALAGRAAISPICAYAKDNSLSRRQLKGAVTLGTVLPAIFYILFVFAIVWLSIDAVTPDALSGLTALPYWILSLLGIFGIFALWTSFFFMGLEVRDILRFDFRFPYGLSLLLVVFTPIILYASGLSNFIWLIGIVGGVFLAMESALVVFMYSRKRGWSAWRIILVAVFVIGALYELLVAF